MKTTLNNVEVWPGVIVSVSSKGFFPGAIRSALGRSYEHLTGQPRRNCPTHTAMIVEYDGGLWVGDTAHPRSHLTPLSDYECELAAGDRWNLQLFTPRFCQVMKQDRASAWWVANVMGRPYDFPAFGRLALKSVFGDIFPCAAGLEWAHWCTEGVMLAYRHGAEFDVFRNNNPTPLTVIKRWTEGVLLEIG